MKKLSTLVTLLAFGVLFYAARDLPRIGDPSSPASSHLSPRFIEQAEHETGAPNMVTAILADYRGFDTLGETVVIFTAGLACLLVLGAFQRRYEPTPVDKSLLEGFGSDVLEAASRLMIPFILLFAAYVLVHGHDSPGGGFQAGAILAAAIILVKLVRGPTNWTIPLGWTMGIASVGVMVYAGIGVACMLAGGTFLDYGVLPLASDTAHARAMATLGIETGVFIAVTAVLVMIFDSLSLGREG